MRGEDCKSTCRWALYAGSPPHARGRRGRGLSGDLVIRITPACAGKTGPGGVAGCSRGDHPRMRGEDNVSGQGLVWRRGSPPHARGRRQHQQIRRSLHRITPACAGKTCCGSSRAGSIRDHPRMRGEDAFQNWSNVKLTGSPPHARGRRYRRRGRRQGVGITPACAGKTLIRCRSRGRSRDHPPRMRGEDALALVISRSRQGSPPHARGRPSRENASWCRTGITPACAGKTPRVKRHGELCADHPRMRGEDWVEAQERCARPGSPPHARGRRYLEADCRGKTGITPACAGKTRTLFQAITQSWDHPRMRGEDGFIDLTIPYAVGSPPHARGRLFPLAGQRHCDGITPACAGKTFLFLLVLVIW